ncbi:hypothetical protein GUITHDRAFT_153184 [Guillardia theta CCMP2712]|uniref:Uncharacterized protein n=1 Tax=Guillardia theta (strain CCMP2712) TaxID=905079 RepID=L1J6X9_GUITC|nr:hypothetical protein GUITHDRAFT_153184 [Guillardia theta CCMP2712]EKX43830.1 hypothetical protein GUITHDRAFT_153184 [Guillardia theta CCMP2712]|mmetsp:Transcript_47661/g.149370  ORF Transcript_47661/g.149370 Transcript_47661/m.149370 type:complete len:357 (-) Transcript_47661:112-1182(-)|eukprot:XP_005830810.1 hypothetical protein GUITHDRAFT_153184 [Guillardia theta CCMP2712]
MDVDNVMKKTKKAGKPSASTARHNSLLSFNDISPLFHDHHPQQDIRARGLGRGSLDRSFPPASPNIRLRPMKRTDYKPKLDQLVGSSTLEECFPNQKKAMALAIATQRKESKPQCLIGGSRSWVRRKRAVSVILSPRVQSPLGRSAGLGTWKSTSERVLMENTSPVKDKSEAESPILASVIGSKGLMELEDSSDSTDSRHSEAQSRRESIKSDEHSIGKSSPGRSVKRDSSFLGLNSTVQPNSSFDPGIVPPQTASWESSGWFSRAASLEKHTDQHLLPPALRHGRTHPATPCKDLELLGIRTYFNGARRIYGRAKSSSSMHNDKSYFFNPLIFESQSLVDVERERSVILKLAKAK